MRFNINKDRLIIVEPKITNSGSIAYYSIECEFDESWNDLTKKAIIIKKGDNQGTEVAVIDNQIYIDKEKYGDYFIGFVGYITDNNTKIRQISTNLEGFYIDKGAGEINAYEAAIPTASEWEIYIQQLQEIANQVSNNKNIVVEDTEYVRSARNEVSKMKEDVEELSDGVRNMSTAIQLPMWYVDDDLVLHQVTATKLSNLDIYYDDNTGDLKEGVRISG